MPASPTTPFWAPPAVAAPPSLVRRPGSHCSRCGKASGGGGLLGRDSAYNDKSQRFSGCSRPKPIDAWPCLPLSPPARSWCHESFPLILFGSSCYAGSPNLALSRTPRTVCHRRCRAAAEEDPPHLAGGQPRPLARRGDPPPDSCAGRSSGPSPAAARGATDDERPCGATVVVSPPPHPRPAWPPGRAVTAGPRPPRRAPPPAAPPRLPCLPVRGAGCRGHSGWWQSPASY